MDVTEFDVALIDAVFGLAGREGWPAVSVARAAREAGLDLSRARLRRPGKRAALLLFGAIADEAMLRDVPTDGLTRDTLFDLLMRRIDVLQARRAGVLALFDALPFDPMTAAWLACLSRRSMAWALEAAGLSAEGVAGQLRTKGLLAVWLWTVRAWRNDASPDLTATMAALDAALRRAEQAALSLAPGARNVPPSAGVQPMGEM